MTAVEDRPAAVWTPPVWTPPSRSWKPLLSTREVQVLERIADGYSNPAIGKELQITVDTVKTHLARMLRKTQTRNRVALVAWGFRTGLLS